MRAHAPALGLVLLLAGAASVQTQEGREWSSPRTAWGDPDLEGPYTNATEALTPLERPPEFAGRRHGDVRGAELQRFRQQVVARRLGGPGPLDPVWPDHLDVTRGTLAWLIVEPDDGRIPALLPDARRRSEADLEHQRRQAARSASAADRSLFERCITRGLPQSMIPGLYGSSYRITQSPDVVAISYEMIHDARIIPLDGRPHVNGTIRMDLGDARGHWDGDTLVVETKNFTERSAYRESDGRALVLTERFRPVGPGELHWSATIDDPNTWARPWTIGLPLLRNEDEAPYEYACHEGNYAMRYILSAARADERFPRRVALLIDRGVSFGRRRPWVSIMALAASAALILRACGRVAAPADRVR